MRFILLNAPPRAGKDSGALAMQLALPGSAIIGFAWHLKVMTHTIYLGRKGADLHPNHFEDVKELPQDILGGMSWRQAYIHYSENVIKPLHGPGWLGERFMDAAREDGSEIIIVPDSGFRSEAEVLVRAVGPENVKLFRVHRPGKTFKGDSRGYIDLSDLGVESADLHNNGSLTEWDDQCQGVVAHLRDLTRLWAGL